MLPAEWKKLGKGISNIQRADPRKAAQLTEHYSQSNK